MATNWPPAAGTYPDWPPPEFAGGYQASDWATMLRDFVEVGFTHSAPTSAENTLYFSNAVRCARNHQVIGRMLVSGDGTRRYPLCVCNNGSHRELLILWSPYTAGILTGPVSF